MGWIKLRPTYPQFTEEPVHAGDGPVHDPLQGLELLLHPPQSAPVLDELQPDGQEPEHRCPERAAGAAAEERARHGREVGDPHEPFDVVRGHVDGCHRLLDGALLCAGSGLFACVCVW